MPEWAILRRLTGRRGWGETWTIGPRWIQVAVDAHGKEILPVEVYGVADHLDERPAP